ncbi:MAG: hypothetical protein WC942_03830 [Clostridia bacterium]|jgi:hypothetical protein
MYEIEIRKILEKYLPTHNKEARIKEYLRLNRIILNADILNIIQKLALFTRSNPLHYKGTKSTTPSEKEAQDILFYHYKNDKKKLKCLIDLLEYKRYIIYDRMLELRQEPTRYKEFLKYLNTYAEDDNTNLI